MPGPDSVKGACVSERRPRRRLSHWGCSILTPRVLTMPCPAPQPLSSWLQWGWLLGGCHEAPAWREGAGCGQHWPCQDPWAGSAAKTLALKSDSPRACAQGLSLASETRKSQPCLWEGEAGASAVLPPPLPLVGSDFTAGRAEDAGSIQQTLPRPGLGEGAVRLMGRGGRDKNTDAHRRPWPPSPASFPSPWCLPSAAVCSPHSRASHASMLCLTARELLCISSLTPSLTPHSHPKH